MADDEYLLIDPAEIDAIRLVTKKTFELVQFVEAAEISPLYYEKPYYIVPTDILAEDAYRVVRDALRKSGRVGLGHLTMRGKEYLCAVRPCGDGLLMETLRYALRCVMPNRCFATLQMLKRTKIFCRCDPVDRPQNGAVQTRSLQGPF